MLATECHKTAVEHGWWESGSERNLGEQLLLVVSEITEAFEEYREGRAPAEIYYVAEWGEKPEGFTVEIADVLIRLFDMLEGQELIPTLAYALSLKIAHN